MTIPLTIAGFAGGIAYFGEMELDPSKPIFVRSVVLSAQLRPLTRPALLHTYLLSRTWTPCLCSVVQPLDVQVRLHELSWKFRTPTSY